MLLCSGAFSIFRNLPAAELEISLTFLNWSWPQYIQMCFQTFKLGEFPPPANWHGHAGPNNCVLCTRGSGTRVLLLSINPDDIGVRTPRSGGGGPNSPTPETLPTGANERKPSWLWNGWTSSRGGGRLPEGSTVVVMQKEKPKLRRRGHTWQGSIRRQ